MNVLILALGAVRDAAVRDAEMVLGHGGAVTVATCDKQGVERLDDAVQILDLSSAEERHPFRRVESKLIVYAPRLITRGLTKVSRFGAKKRGLVRPARMVYKVSRVVDGVHRKVIGLHRRTITRRVRPIVLWQSAGRVMVRDVDIDKYDLVIVDESMSLVTAWHLARRFPNVPVRTHQQGRIPRELLGQSS
jgi:hypothetical protein